VTRTRILVAVLAAVALMSSSCGTGDKIASVSMQVVGSGGAGTVNLSGLGGTLQLQVLANYTSGKSIDETNFSNYMVVPEGTYCTAFSGTTTCSSSVAMPTPPQGVTLNKTGMLTAVDPGVCSWINLGTQQQQSWFYTGYYAITATYRGFTSNPVYIPVASAANAQTTTNGQCGPSATGQ